MNNYGSASKQTSKPAAQTSTAVRRDTTKQAKTADKVAVPVVEEELKVGKRDVNRGGVRVSSRVVETPVENDVLLRDEEVHVERHPVDRPAQAKDLEAFQGGTVEFVEVDEEAVVAEEAWVVEEVVVSKDVTQRTDKVHETLRHTEVQVEPIQATGVAHRFEHYDPEFRKDYEAGAYSKLGYAYEHMVPAYQYGYQFGTSEDFKYHTWDAIEAQAGAAWEARNPGTWAQMKLAARHAWEKVTGRR